MSAACDEQPPLHFAQRKPPEWDHLVATCDQALNLDEPYNRQKTAVELLWQEGGTLDIEAYEANRYYSVGLVICAFYKSLQSQEGEAGFVAQAARTLFFRHNHYCNFNAYLPKNEGLYVDELRVGQTALVSAAHVADELHTSTRLIANTLALARPLTEDGQKPSLPDSLARRVLHDDLVLGNIAKNSLAGAMWMMRFALINRADHAAKSSVAEKETLPLLVKEVADEATIAQIDLSQPAIIGASLRMDELREIRAWLQRDKTGALVVDRSKIPKDPGPVRQDPCSAPVKHTRRLRCPALYVNGAIPFVAKVTPQIVNEAQSYLLPS